MYDFKKPTLIFSLFFLMTLNLNASERAEQIDLNDECLRPLVDRWLTIKKSYPMEVLEISTLGDSHIKFTGVDDEGYIYYGYIAYDMTIKQNVDWNKRSDEMIFDPPTRTCKFRTACHYSDALVQSPLPKTSYTKYQKFEETHIFEIYNKQAIWGTLTNVHGEAIAVSFNQNAHPRH